MNLAHVAAEAQRQALGGPSKTNLRRAPRLWTAAIDALLSEDPG